MNYRRLAEIGCRFIALNIFVTYLGYIPSVIIAFSEMKREIEFNQGMSLMSSIFPPIFMLLLSFLLWVNAQIISKLLVKEECVEEITGRVDYHQIQLIVFSFAGVLIAAKALPEVINLVTQVVWFKGQQIISKGDRTYIIYISRIMSQCLQMLIGLWLILGAKGISKGIALLRAAGVHGDTEDEG